MTDIAHYADVVELRADKLKNNDIGSIQIELGRLAALPAALPVILTPRSAAEGGEWPIDDEAGRLTLVKATLSLCSAVDSEINAKITPEVIEAAHELDKTAIGSFHDLSKTPSLGELDDILGRSKELGADICKIATRADTRAEYDTLQRFTRNNKEESIMVVGIGKFGPASRVELPLIGSDGTFAAANKKPVVEGQLGFKQTREGLERGQHANLQLNTCYLVLDT
jgi:3-dehydroquinate dehydratase-1